MHGDFFASISFARIATRYERGVLLPTTFHGTQGAAIAVPVAEMMEDLPALRARAVTRQMAAKTRERLAGRGYTQWSAMEADLAIALTALRERAEPSSRTEPPLKHRRRRATH